MILGQKDPFKKKSSTTFSYIKLIQFVYTRIAIEAATISWRSLSLLQLFPALGDFDNAVQTIAVEMS